MYNLKKWLFIYILTLFRIQCSLNYMYILFLFSHYQAQKDSPDVQWKVNWIFCTVFLLTCLFKA